MLESLQLRVHGDASQPTLIYLPGLHGDWTLVSSFRAAVAGSVRFVEFTYPRTTTWSLRDYAEAVMDALIREHVNTGWILAESFGSQVAWSILELCEQAGSTAGRGFAPQGLILAGGFVRYPLMWGVRWVSAVHEFLSLPAVCFLLKLYAAYACLRHRRAPETLDSIREFVQRRSDPVDKRAIEHRYRLITVSDPRALARRTTLPVCHLTGFVDPIVPFWLVRPWLRRHCPGFRESRLIWRADHNVLGTAPAATAERILLWMNPVEPMKYAVNGASPAGGSRTGLARKS